MWTLITNQVALKKQYYSFGLCFPHLPAGESTSYILSNTSEMLGWRKNPRSTLSLAMFSKRIVLGSFLNKQATVELTGLL